MPTVIAYLATLAAFAVIDVIWLGVVARSFYRRELGPLLADPINWVAGMAFYLVFALGIVLFAVAPAVESGSIHRALVLGGLFGFFAYATYDLTSLATTKGFPLRLALVDMAWGAALTAAAAAIGAAVTLQAA